MNASIYKKAASGVLVMVLPLMAGCSVFSGGGLSSDPVIAAQQQEVRDLEQELKEAERYSKEAKEREKAAKNRLKAAEHELKALESQAKRRGY